MSSPNIPGAGGLSIVMPCLNEEETLAQCVVKARSSLERLGLEGEVIIADNGSTDNSRQIAEKSGARVVPVTRKGYGAAITGGITAANTEWILLGDADDSYNFAEIGPFIEKLREGNDLVMGCRLPWGGGTIMPKAMPWKHKWLGNPVLSFIGQLFFHCPITDFHCGMRAFRKDAWERMDLRTTGMEFASEMVIKATLKQMKIAQVPITLYKDGRSRPPHLRSWRDGWRHLRFMLLFSPRWLFLYPGLAMMALGALIVAALLPGHLRLGAISLSTNTMLVGVALLAAGFQTVFSGIFARKFATRAGLLPESPWLAKWVGLFSLERGAIVGLALCTLGLASIAFVGLHWAREGFGELSFEEGQRFVVPSFGLVLIGFLCAMNSFMLSVFDLEQKSE